MALTDNVPDYPGDLNVNLDFGKIKDGAKYLTILMVEKAAFAQRAGIVEPEADIYIFQALLDYLIEFKKSQAFLASQQAAITTIKAEKNAIEAQLADVKLEVV